jgi:hypothetical protein
VARAELRETRGSLSWLSRYRLSSALILLHLSFYDACQGEGAGDYGYTRATRTLRADQLRPRQLKIDAGRNSM